MPTWWQPSAWALYTGGRLLPSPTTDLALCPGVQCEVLAHRLGLVPLQLDPELFKDKAGALVAAVPTGGRAQQSWQGWGSRAGLCCYP